MKGSREGSEWESEKEGGREEGRNKRKDETERVPLNLLNRHTSHN